jgi:predicted permease
MSWFRRLRNTMMGIRLERNLDDELRFHLESRIGEYINSGMSPEEARREALRRFGNVPHAKKRARDMDILQWLESVWRDLSYGWRTMWRTPGITVAAILSLGLGIGANTAIFTLMDTVMFKMLPVRQPEQLEEIRWAAPKYPEKLLEQGRGSSKDDSGGFSADFFSSALFDRLRTPNAGFESVFAQVKFYEKANIVVNGRGDVADGQLVSGNYFAGLGVRPILGRLISEENDRAGATPVAVISYRYWQKRFNGDPAVVGQSIAVNSVPVTVIGVTPREFFGVSVGESPDFSLPLHAQPQVVPRWAETGKSMFLDDKYWWMQLMGRRRPGVAEEQARVSLNAVFKQSLDLAQLKPEEWPQIRLVPASRGLDEMRARFSEPLAILMAIVGLVLMIACANVANLMLARSAARQREAAMRHALGAARGRLIRQMFTESLLLAILGGLLGFGVAQWAGTVLIGMIPRGSMPVVLQVTPDLRMIGFTALVSLLTGVLFGLMPAFRATRVDLNSALKEGRGVPSGRYLSGKLLVASQAALSLLLLVVAGLFLRSLTKLNSVDLGFQPDNVLVFATDPSLAGHQEKETDGLLLQVLDAVRSVPGVRAASLSTQRLISNRAMIIGIDIPGSDPAHPKEVGAWVLTVDPEFFKTMGVPLLAGRLLEDRDGPGAPRVAVASETFARQFFGGANPVGRTLDIGIREKTRYEIVGVVKDSHYTRVRGETPPMLYYSYRQHLDYVRRVHLELRTAGDPWAVFPAVRRALEVVDPLLPLFDVTTQRAQIDDHLKLERSFATLAGCFGAVALILAMVGLYGVLSYSVSCRTGEIGVRMALGAGRREVLVMILRESVLTVTAGLGAGLGLAYASTRVMQNLLYGLQPHDPATLLGATLVMLGASVLAAWMPARRAARVDPMVALRHE